MFGVVVVDLGQVIVGDFVQVVVQFGGDVDVVELGVFVDDCQDGVDVVCEQFGWYFFEIWGMFDDLVQVFGDVGGCWKIECCGIVFDVVGGVKQFVVVWFGEVIGVDCGIGC